MTEPASEPNSSAVRRLRGASRLTSGAIGVGLYTIATALGVAALLYPLWGPAWLGDASVVSGKTTPLLLSLVVTFCLAALLFEAGSGGLGMRAISVLGVLVATNSTLRFAEVAFPGPGGFSPIFLLIILTGYAYGARMGFLLGSLTLALSALITGGVGPWLPYQMLAAGWVGLTSGWIPRIGGTGTTTTRAELVLLAAVGAAWGLLYGVAMTLWFWPYLEPGGQALAAASHAAGYSPPLERFLAFYVTTSLPWDVFRSAGNVALVLLVGAPVLAALRRFGLRFRFTTSASNTSDPLPEDDSPISRDNTIDAVEHYMPARDAEPSHSGRPDELIDPRAWLSWLLAIAALASLTRHPLVLLTAGIAVGVVRAALPRGPRRGALPVGKMALLFFPVAAMYSFLTIHSGATVVVRLPADWLLIGGPLTIESLFYGLVTAGTLTVLLAAFAALRQALSARSLIRLIPRGYGELSLVGAVALAYVPSVTRQAAAVREAQTIRGHRVEGISDLVPLAVPVLVGGLERAIELSESVASRGLFSVARPSPRARLLLLGGVTLVAAGWTGFSMDLIPPSLAIASALLGVASAAGAVISTGRRTPYTAYRERGWRLTDCAVALAPWAPLLLALMSPAVSSALAYTPYPQISLPPLDPLLAVSLLGTAAPAAVLVARSAVAHSTRRHTVE